MSLLLVKRLSAYFAVVVVAMSLYACATLQQQLETPEVDIVSVVMGEQQGLTQMFDVTLAVSNPNGINLNLVGLNYTLALEGLDVIKGSANNIPTIPAYGEQNINIRLGIGLLEGLQFLNKLSQKNDANLNYALQLNLDTGLPIIGVIPISKKGVLDSQSFAR